MEEGENSKADPNQLVCWHDGELKKLSAVSVSVFDFGFIHSDATYDVFRTIDFKPCYFDLHKRRFFESCRYFDFEPIDHLQEITQQLLEKNQIADAFVWCLVWRGAPPSGGPRDVNAPQHSLVYIKPYYPLKKDGAGLKLTIDTENRRVPDSCYLQKSKNFGWIEFNLAHRRAVKAGFDSAVVLSTEGFISEGPGFSIAFVREGKVYTPKRDCLGSITIEVLERACVNLGVPFEKRDIDPQFAKQSDEVMLCSTSGGLTPVFSLDEVRFSSSGVSLVLAREMSQLALSSN